MLSHHASTADKEKKTFKGPINLVHINIPAQRRNGCSEEDQKVRLGQEGHHDA
jgi:hypothetical protein